MFVAELLEQSSLLTGSRLAILLPAIIYMLWRVWTFIIKPSLNPREAKEMPYLIPYLGHIFGFFKNSDNLYSACRNYFGDTKEIFAITLVGERLYVVTSPQDTITVYKNTLTLSFDEFIADMVSALGISQEGNRKCWAYGDENTLPMDEAKPLPHRCEEIYRTQFLQGSGKFSEFFPHIQRYTDLNLRWENISKMSSIIHKTSHGESMRVNLWQWTRQYVINATARAMFGQALLDIQPEVARIFAEFEDPSWKLSYKIPPYMAKDVYVALDQLKAMFRTYLQLPEEKRSDASWAVTMIIKEMTKAGLSTDDQAVLLLLPMWVTSSNPYKLTYWLINFILHNAQLADEIRAEIKNALPGPSETLSTRLEEQCPKFVSAYLETLRLTTASNTVRGVLADTQVGTVLLKKGRKVVIPYRQFHMDQAAWGPSAAYFDPERFMNRKLERSPSYKPFGGGSTFCPGRFIAMKQVLVFVAMAIDRFDVRLPMGAPFQGLLPTGTLQDVVATIDVTQPTSGMMQPRKGTKIDVVLRNAKKV